MNTVDQSLMTSALLRWFDELADRGIFTTDTDLRIRTWNRWLEAQTGMSADSVIGRPLLEVSPSIAERGLDGHFRDALNGEVRVLSERFHKYLIPISRNFHTTGITEMAQSARIAPLEHDGRIVGTITVIDDVTERVVSEREMRAQIGASERARRIAEEASRLKDEFLATLSHEIRTPLNAVLGWAQILKTQPRLRSRAHAIEVIERNAMSQLRLVEDLLDMARVISGKLRLDVSDVVLDEVVRAAIDVVTPAADAKKIVIHYSGDATATVSGDADRLQQVVWNLLSNAVKFTGEGGAVDVAVTRRDSYVALTVKDTGQGIAHDFLPYVFDRFRQADASPSRRHGGLGVGLALVRQIVELHGGIAGVESAGPGRGATFSVQLPVAASATAGAASVKIERRAVTLKGVGVLLVDDDEDGRDLLVTALRDFGARVFAVTSAAEALRVLEEKRFRPDVLVSDVGMPEADGYQLIRQIRTADPSLNLPAIAVTAYADPEDRIRALVAGFQTHIPKPVDLGMLAAAIASLLPAAPRRTQTASGS